MFCCEDAMGNHAKHLAEVKVKDIHCCHLMHRTSHLNIEGEEAGQTWFAFSHSYWLSATFARFLVHYNEPFSFTKEDKTAFLDPSVHSLTKAVTNLHTFNQTFLITSPKTHHLHQGTVFQEHPGLLASPTTTVVCNICKAPSSYFKAWPIAWPDGQQQMFTPALLMLFCLRLSTHSRAKHCALPALLCMHCPSLPACIPPSMHSSILLCTLTPHVFVMLRCSESV